MKATTNVAALIPAYNESLQVESVVARARKHLPVLVIDDGSTDDTASRAKDAGAFVLQQTSNQGKGAALKVGFRWALEQGFAAAMTLDADGQHDPAEIPGFLNVYQNQHPDLVIGERDFSRMPLLRRISNTLGRWLFSWALARHVADNQSGFRLISRKLMEAALESREKGFEFEVEMIVLCVRQGWPMASVPIRTLYRGERSHINNFAHLVNFLRMVWRTRFSRRE